MVRLASYVVNNAIWVHTDGSWWRLRWSDLVFHQYLEGSLVKALHHKHGRPFRAQAASTIGVHVLRGLH